MADVCIGRQIVEVGYDIHRTIREYVVTAGCELYIDVAIVVDSRRAL
jgi:hypothetical protein